MHVNIHKGGFIIDDFKSAIRIPHSAITTPL